MRLLPRFLLAAILTYSRAGAADAPAAAPAPGTPEYDNSPRANAITTGAVDLGPREWIDPDTGHRVIRISDEPNSQSLYFHYNSYTPEGDKMVYGGPSGLFILDLKTLGQGTPKVDWVVDGRNPAAAADSTAAPAPVSNASAPAASGGQGGEGLSTAGQGTLTLTGRSGRGGRVAAGSVRSWRPLIAAMSITPLMASSTPSMWTPRSRASSRPVGRGV